jgi:hypothetical protein
LEPEREFAWFARISLSLPGLRDTRHSSFGKILGRLDRESNLPAINKLGTASTLAQEFVRKEGALSMREYFRDGMLTLGVILAGLQDFLVWRGNDPQVSSTTPISITRPLGGLILVAALFIVAGVLNIAPLFIRRFFPNSDSSKGKAGGDNENKDPFHNPNWETVSRQQFTNESVDVDGKRFYDCTFRNVKLSFHGKAPSEFLGPCTFTGDIVLSTDSGAAMHYSKLCQEFSNIPNTKVRFARTDAKGNELPSTFEVSQLPPPRPHIYIAPVGMPVRIADKKVTLTLAAFASAPTRLLHIKAYVGNSPHLVTIDDADPQEIKALEPFLFCIDQSLSDSELEVFNSETVRVQGTAKFSDNVESTFDFPTVPYRH